MSTLGINDTVFSKSGITFIFCDSQKSHFNVWIQVSQLLVMKCLNFFLNYYLLFKSVYCFFYHKSHMTISSSRQLMTFSMHLNLQKRLLQQNKKNYVNWNKNFNNILYWNYKTHYKMDNWWWRYWSAKKSLLISKLNAIVIN